MLETCLQEMVELDKEYDQLEEEHKVYCKKVEEVKAIQRKCMSKISHQRYRLKQVQDNLKRVEKGKDAESQEKVKELKEKLAERKDIFRELEEVLPHENGTYLKVILGSVNVSLLSKADKYKYKEDYERFKLILTIISLVLAILLFFVQYRVTDAAFQFLLVWYYCTLTIREHILIVNGSRIKGWWVSHHFISTLCAGILLIWPEGYAYTEFRSQFVAFSLYVSLVQLLQYYYQRGCLYRLRSLGERHTMDITVEGFQSYMWKGLTFLLPFLIGGYLFQLYNAYVLFNLSLDELTTEWHVQILSGIFFILFLGNSFTMSAVIRNKIFKEVRKMEFALTNKYRFSNKVHQT